MSLFDKLKEFPNTVTEVIHLYGNYFLAKDTLYFFSKEILYHISPTYYLKKDVFIFKHSVYDKYTVYDLDRELAVGAFYDDILLYDDYVFLKKKDKTDIYFFKTKVFIKGEHNKLVYINEEVVYDYKNNILLNEYGNVILYIDDVIIMKKEKEINSINVTNIQNSNLNKITFNINEDPIYYMYATNSGELVYSNSKKLILD